jgi:ribonuclease-3
MTLEEELGYTFDQPSLLGLALTHRSVSSEDPGRADNERLEFLGDAVLQLVVTDYLYSTYPDLAEGKLAKIRASVVSRQSLALVARGMGIGEHIEMTQAEDRTGGREKDSIIADAVEAVIGAVYLDGGLDSAGKVVLRLWGGQVDDLARRPGLKDYKSRLQEVLAADGRRPVYSTDGSGPDHERLFVSQVSVDGTPLGDGMGRTKREAEQAAAEQAIEMLRRGGS